MGGRRALGHTLQGFPEAHFGMTPALSGRVSSCPPAALPCQLSPNLHPVHPRELLPPRHHPWGGSGGMQQAARSLKKRGSNPSWGESDTLTLCLAACGKGAPQNPMWGHRGGSAGVPIPASRCASPGVGGWWSQAIFYSRCIPKILVKCNIKL